MLQAVGTRVEGSYVVSQEALRKGLPNAEAVLTSMFKGLNACIIKHNLKLERFSIVKHYDEGRDQGVKEDLPLIDFADYVHGDYGLAKGAKHQDFLFEFAGGLKLFIEYNSVWLGNYTLPVENTEFIVETDKPVYALVHDQGKQTSFPVEDFIKLWGNYSLHEGKSNADYVVPYAVFPRWVYNYLRSNKADGKNSADGEKLAEFIGLK